MDQIIPKLSTAGDEWKSPFGRNWLFDAQIQISENMRAHQRLTTEQIRNLNARLREIAIRHGWIDDLEPIVNTSLAGARLG